MSMFIKILLSIFLIDLSLILILAVVDLIYISISETEPHDYIFNNIAGVLGAIALGCISIGFIYAFILIIKNIFIGG